MRRTAVLALGLAGITLVALLPPGSGQTGQSGFQLGGVSPVSGNWPVNPQMHCSHVHTAKGPMTCFVWATDRQFPTGVSTMHVRLVGPGTTRVVLVEHVASHPPTTRQWLNQVCEGAGATTTCDFVFPLTAAATMEMRFYTNGDAGFTAVAWAENRAEML